MSQFGKDMILSSETNHAYISTRDHLSWLTGLKAKYDLFVDYCPVLDMSGWEKTETEIVRHDKKFFRIIGVNVTISNREVASCANHWLNLCNMDYAHLLLERSMAYIISLCKQN